MATAWRVAAVCALVAGIAMMFNIPESAISCYLVIFLMKADGAENMVVAIAATLAITLLIALMIPIIQWTVESASLRIVIMIAVSFAFIFLGAASKLGEGGSIVALIIAFILTLVNEVPVNGVISMALRYAWEMAILPMLVIAVFSLYFGRWSVSLLRQELRERLLLARQALLNGPAPLVAEKLAAGNDDESKRAMLVRILHQTSQKNAARIKADIPASYQLLFAVSALPEAASVESRHSYASEIDAMVDALDRGAPPPPPPLAEDKLPCAQARAIRQALNTLAGQQEPRYRKGAGERFFAADAFTNPAYQRFALKTTLAAILCYMFYAAINWQGIHTAMVTCLVGHCRRHAAQACAAHCRLSDRCGDWRRLDHSPDAADGNRWQLDGAGILRRLAGGLGCRGKRKTVLCGGSNRPRLHPDGPARIWSHHRYGYRA